MSGEVRDKHDQDACAYEIVKKDILLSLLYLKKKLVLKVMEEAGHGVSHPKGWCRIATNMQPAWATENLPVLEEQKASVVVHLCDPSTLEAEAGGFLF